MNFFDELKTSLEQAVEIKNGTLSRTQRTRYELADVKMIQKQPNVLKSELAQTFGTSVATIKS